MDKIPPGRKNQSDQNTWGTGGVDFAIILKIHV